MKRPTTFLCAAAAAAACLTAVAALSRAPSPSAASEPAAPAAATQLVGPVTPYTLVQRQTVTPAGGQSFLRAEKRRYQRADGLFAVAHIYYRRDGSVEAEVTGVGVPGVGLFRTDEENGRLEFLAAHGEDAHSATEERLRADTDFVREEAVLGQRALVARGGGADSARRREVWRAPALQNFELKVVEASPRGEEVTEPTELRLGEPDAAPFRTATLPRSFARFEGRIREAERRGEAELATRLRRHLERARR